MGQKPASSGRSTQEVRLVRMDENDQVAAACLIPEAEEKGEDDGQENLTLQQCWVQAH